jgi:hypothetical protein
MNSKTIFPRLFCLLILFLLLPGVGASSCTQGGETPSMETRIEALEAAMPGVGDLMSNVQLHFAKLYYGARAGNWDLATFELQELEENLEKAVRLRPEENGVRLKEIYGAFKGTELEAMKRAAVSKDPASFERAYRQSVTVCNSCHAATGRPFLTITLPSGPPVTNQLWKPRPSRVSEEN